MALQLADNALNGIVSRYEFYTGTLPTISLFTGAKPVDCAAPDTGTLLVTIPLPADWMESPPFPTPGSVAKRGVWPTTNAIAAGVPGYFRLKASSSAVMEQGTVTAVGGGGNLQFDNVNFAVGTPVTLTAWTRTQAAGGTTSTSAQLGFQMRNDMVNQYESQAGATIGTPVEFRLLTGAMPLSVGAAQTGTLLASVTLPVDWMNTAPASGGGTVTKIGIWPVVSAVATGTAGYFRLVQMPGSLAYEQGTVTIAGGGGDLIIDQLNTTNGQPVTITGWTRTQPGA